ncbi:MAG: hypothetical protein OXT09_36540 [Myxococcales bacterium]|nr:hypothetical protein [Myxococcales bacterium]
MRSNLVLTLIGDDRPGLVDALSEAIATHGGNWEESRMAHLAGKFAGVLRVSLPSDAQPALEAALSELEGRRGLRIVVESSERVGGGAELQRMRLEVVGNDHEGIVRDLAHALAARKINVEELQTSTEDAPMAGGQLFKATVMLGMPAGVSADALRDTLEDLADDLMVDVHLDPVD